MIHYENNIQVVIHTLENYGYSPRAIRQSEVCFAQLRHWYQEQGISTFTWVVSWNWVESEEVISRKKKAFRAAIQRLTDVYETGEVARSHLFFYGRSLPLVYQEAKAGFVASQAEKYSSKHLTNISDACNRFLGFLCVNGIRSPAEITYSILDLYTQDIKQTTNTPSMAEGLTEGLLFYLAEYGYCSYGLGWYMHFSRLGKTPVGDDFPLELARKMEDSEKYDAEYIRQRLPEFLDALRGYHYCQPVVNTSEDVVILLYVLLDMSGVHYSKALAEVWIYAAGPRLFKSSFGMARRALELYDDFLTNGKVDPFKRWKHTTSALELLPEWCKTPVERFMEQKRRENRSEKTVSSYAYSATSFCLYILSRGLHDFYSLTPGIVKAFNAQKEHLSASGRSECNREVRKFLHFLFREGLHNQVNLYLALPVCSASRERIVEVLTDEEKRQIQQYKENAASPLALRDAAILTLGLKMGFRGCDIANLHFSNIDWKSCTISLTQEKTDTMIRLPMPNSVGNAIYKYLKNGRPSTTVDTHVFLKVRAPHGPISSAECRHALMRALSGSGCTKFHTTRRTFATDMLRSGVHVSAIADSLGHSNIATVHRYLSLDEDRMRLCALSFAEMGLSSEGRSSNE